MLSGAAAPERARQRGEPLEVLGVLGEARADVAEADRKPGFPGQFVERLRRFGVGREQSSSGAG